jgi:hypothetical protein
MLTVRGHRQPRLPKYVGTQFRLMAMAVQVSYSAPVPLVLYIFRGQLVAAHFRSIAVLRGHTLAW